MKVLIRGLGIIIFILWNYSILNRNYDVYKNFYYKLKFDFIDN